MELNTVYIHTSDTYNFSSRTDIFPPVYIHGRYIQLYIIERQRIGEGHISAIYRKVVIILLSDGCVQA